MFVDPRDIRTLCRKHPASCRGSSIDARDIQSLRQIIQGPGNDGDRVRALNAYRQSGEPDAIRLLAELLLDPKQGETVRISAAAGLGRCGSLAEPLLLQALEQQSSCELQSKVIKALGRVAGTASIPVLQRIAATAEEIVRSQAAFSLQLAAHRGGLRELVRCPGGIEILEAVELRAVEVRDVAANYVQSVIEEIGTDNFGIEFDRGPSVDFECPGSQQTLLINSQARPFGKALHTVDRPMILGLLAARSREEGHRFVSRVILAGPVDGDRFYVTVHRTDGRLMHQGAGTVREAMTELTLQSVDTVGNFALQARVRFGDRIVWEEVKAGRHIIRSRTPDAYVPDGAHRSPDRVMTAAQAATPDEGFR
jgi:hypothetical protein